TVPGFFFLGIGRAQTWRAASVQLFASGDPHDFVTTGQLVPRPAAAINNPALSREVLERLLNRLNAFFIDGFIFHGHVPLPSAIKFRLGAITFRSSAPQWAVPHPRSPSASLPSVSFRKNSMSSSVASNLSPKPTKLFLELRSMYLP